MCLKNLIKEKNYYIYYNQIRDRNFLVEFYFLNKKDIFHNEILLVIDLMFVYFMYKY